MPPGSAMSSLCVRAEPAGPTGHDRQLDQRGRVELREQLESLSEQRGGDEVKQLGARALISGMERERGHHG
jgi:hypothetical protein